MSYTDQLRSVFTDEELKVLGRLVADEHVATLSDITSTDKRLIRQIRDKVHGRQQISSARTTPPDKL